MWISEDTPEKTVLQKYISWELDFIQWVNYYLLVVEWAVTTADTCLVLLTREFNNVKLQKWEDKKSNNMNAFHDLDFRNSYEIYLWPINVGENELCTNQPRLFANKVK